MNQQETSTTNRAERTIDVIDAEIEVLRAERAKLFELRKATLDPGANDEIAVGEPGRLFTLSGVAIIGTNEVVPGTAKLLSAKRKADGSLELDLDETSLSWDGALTATNDLHEKEFVTVKGTIVPESQVKLVPLRWQRAVGHGVAA
ncbi:MULTISPECIES: hypothetical protein [Cupriavidus]|uniref:hypothetical protein n=1 Tax=Cupriavidus TaxID=106589 RepID=UPI0011ECB9E9|nr:MULTISPECIES: hypothetical protein [Cupriavidus]MWL91767.1 hypothetical protein [Cupriavidus sp. SW-Y-13]